LRDDFGIAAPRIAVLGLNPHAGEDGHLGHEERDLIIPLLERLRGEGWNLIGPLPADTAFLPTRLPNYDAVLAMYHDQGLPVLKYSDFAHAVNITLGLPYPRVAVDHGTALELAGQGIADPSSLFAAIETCTHLARTRIARVHARMSREHASAATPRSASLRRNRSASTSCTNAGSSTNSYSRSTRDPATASSRSVRARAH
jgi:hypothetical protein